MVRLCILIIPAIYLSCTQEVIKNENFYADKIQKAIGGEREVSVSNGRVDLVTNEYAFEIEWAWNWKEAVGQSLWYGLQTNKKPGIILIMRQNAEFKYVQQLESALQYSNLSEQIHVLLYPTDFDNSPFSIFRYR